MGKVRVYEYQYFMKQDFPFKMVKLDSGSALNKITHAHEHLQICYVSKGTCMHEVCEKNSILVKGDIFSIPPFIEHKMVPIENKQIELVQIDFMPFFINENMAELNQMDGFIDFAYIQPFVSMEEKPLPKLNLSATSQNLVEQLIFSMQMELGRQEEGYQLAIKADLLKLLIMVGREFKNFYKGKQEKQILKVHHKAFYSAMQYIQEHYNEDLSLSDMAKKSNMSMTYYSQVFKLITGKTFTEYHNDLKINKAMGLLLHTDMNVTEICYQVGYNNLGHFNRIFKKSSGLTPTEYRKVSATENK